MIPILTSPLLPAEKLAGEKEKVSVSERNRTPKLELEESHLTPNYYVID